MNNVESEKRRRCSGRIIKKVNRFNITDFENEKIRCSGRITKKVERFCTSFCGLKQPKNIVKQRKKILTPISEPCHKKSHRYHLRRHIHQNEANRFENNSQFHEALHYDSKPNKKIDCLVKYDNLKCKMKCVIIDIASLVAKMEIIISYNWYVFVPKQCEIYDLVESAEKISSFLEDKLYETKDNIHLEFEYENFRDQMNKCNVVLYIGKKILHQRRYNNCENAFIDLLNKNLYLMRNCNLNLLLGYALIETNKKKQVLDDIKLEIPSDYWSASPRQSKEVKEELNKGQSDRVLEAASIKNNLNITVDAETCDRPKKYILKKQIHTLPKLTKKKGRRKNIRSYKNIMGYEQQCDLELSMINTRSKNKIGKNEKEEAVSETKPTDSQEKEVVKLVSDTEVFKQQSSSSHTPSKTNDNSSHEMEGSLKLSDSGTSDIVNILSNSLKIGIISPTKKNDTSPNEMEESFNLTNLGTSYPQNSLNSYTEIGNNIMKSTCEKKRSFSYKMEESLMLSDPGTSDLLAVLNSCSKIGTISPSKKDDTSSHEMQICLNLIDPGTIDSRNILNSNPEISSNATCKTSDACSHEMGEPFKLSEPRTSDKQYVQNSNLKIDLKVDDMTCVENKICIDLATKYSEPSSANKLTTNKRGRKKKHQAVESHTNNEKNISNQVAVCNSESVLLKKRGRKKKNEAASSTKKFDAPNNKRLMELNGFGESLQVTHKNVEENKVKEAYSEENRIEKQNEDRLLGSINFKKYRKANVKIRKSATDNTLDSINSEIIDEKDMFSTSDIGDLMSNAMIEHELMETDFISLIVDNEVQVTTTVNENICSEQDISSLDLKHDGNKFDGFEKSNPKQNETKSVLNIEKGDLIEKTFQCISDLMDCPNYDQTLLSEFLYKKINSSSEKKFDEKLIDHNYIKTNNNVNEIQASHETKGSLKSSNDVMITDNQISTNCKTVNQQFTNLRSSSFLKTQSFETTSLKNTLDEVLDDKSSASFESVNSTKIDNQNRFIVNKKAPEHQDTTKKNSTATNFDKFLPQNKTAIDSGSVKQIGKSIENNTPKTEGLNKNSSLLKGLEIDKRTFSIENQLSSCKIPHQKSNNGFIFISKQISTNSKDSNQQTLTNKSNLNFKPQSLKPTTSKRSSDESEAIRDTLGTSAYKSKESSFKKNNYEFQQDENINSIKILNKNHFIDNKQILKKNDTIKNIATTSITSSNDKLLPHNKAEIDSGDSLQQLRSTNLVGKFDHQIVNCTPQKQLLLISNNVSKGIQNINTIFPIENQFESRKLHHETKKTECKNERDKYGQSSTQFINHKGNINDVKDLEKPIILSKKNSECSNTLINDMEEVVGFIPETHKSVTKTDCTMNVGLDKNLISCNDITNNANENLMNTEQFVEGSVDISLSQDLASQTIINNNLDDVSLANITKRRRYTRPTDVFFPNLNFGDLDW